MEANVILVLITLTGIGIEGTNHLHRLKGVANDGCTISTFERVLQNNGRHI